MFDPREKDLLKKWIARSAVSAIVIGVVALVTPTIPAAAGTVDPASTCSTPYCGGIITNHASRGIFVANNWCWSTSNPYFGSTLPCAPTWNDHAYNSFFYLGIGDTTLNYPYYYDTDAFRVDANCIVTVYDGFENITYSNRGSSIARWEKISSVQRYTVQIISC